MRSSILGIMRALVGATVLIAAFAPLASVSEPGQFDAAGQRSIVLAADSFELINLERTLSIVDSIPNDVLRQGPKATEAWLNRTYGPNEDSKAIGSLAQCAGGIAWAIGSNAIAVAKILKIKSAIKGLGGVGIIVEKVRAKTQEGKKLMDAVHDVFEQAGVGIGAIAAEFFGIDKVIEYCF